MAITEKIELLGKGLYASIPDELTLTSIPTASELDYIGSDDFDATMLDKILPKAVVEDINFRELLEIDYNWICRCLRILNYGSYYTVGSIYCPNCGVKYGEYQIDLQSIECLPLPEGFTNDIVIPKSEFMDFNGDVHIHLLTIQDYLNSQKDKAFQGIESKPNSQLARMCYMISSMGNQKGLPPFEIKMKLEKTFSAFDYQVLKQNISNLTNYGLRAGGTTRCPECGSNEAAFLALVDERYFRPTLDDLRRWRDSRGKRSA